MANGTHKSKVLNRLFSLAKGGAPEEAPAPRPVLEQVIFGILREGTTPAKAEHAFRSLKTSFFDWNEIRVSTVREVADAIRDLPHPEQRARRIISILRQVFETTYSFDLDSLHKKGLKMAEKQLQRYEGMTEFVLAYTLQNGLGGHALPIDEPMARTLRRLELISGQDWEASRASLEHLVPKAKGVLFCDTVCAIAHDYCHETGPDCGHCPMQDACPFAKNLAPKAKAPGSRAKAR